jgi:membrane protein required for colicin V production
MFEARDVQTYDFLMLLVLAGMTFYGFTKGLAWQIAYIASLVVSYFVALNFSAQLAPTFGDTEPWNRFVAMLVIYVGTSLVIWILFRGVSGFINRVKLKEFDHQMGALVGLARGVLWCVAITFFAVTLLESQRDRILASQSGHYIAMLLDKTDAVVPKEIHDVIGPYLDRARTEIDPSRAGTPPSDAPLWPSSSPQQPSGWAAPPASPPAAQPAAPAWPSSTPNNSGGPAWPTGGGNASPAWPSDTGRTSAPPVGSPW